MCYGADKVESAGNQTRQRVFGMITQENSMKLLVVAGVYLAVALIVTTGFVLRSNSVAAATEPTVHGATVADQQQMVSLDERYERLGVLATQLINDETATAMVNEAVAIADQYLSEEIDDPKLRSWVRGAVKEHGLPYVKQALAEVPGLEVHLKTVLKHEL